MSVFEIKLGPTVPIFKRNFSETSKMASNRKVSFVDNIPSTSSGENVNMDPETAKRLFEIGATLILVMSGR